MNKRILRAVLFAAALFSALVFLGFDIANLEDVLSSLETLWSWLKGIFDSASSPVSVPIPRPRIPVQQLPN